MELFLGCLLEQFFLRYIVNGPLAGQKGRGAKQQLSLAAGIIHPSLLPDSQEEGKQKKAQKITWGSDLRSCNELCKTQGYGCGMQGEERAESRAPAAASHTHRHPAPSLAEPPQQRCSEAETFTETLAFQNGTLRCNYFSLLPVISSLS